MGRAHKKEDMDFLRAIALSPDPIVTAPEMAERLDYSTDGARLRLKDLAEQGLVGKRKVGARATVWWITEDGQDVLSATTS